MQISGTIVVRWIWKWLTKQTNNPAPHNKNRLCNLCDAAVHCQTAINVYEGWSNIMPPQTMMPGLGSVWCSSNWTFNTGLDTWRVVIVIVPGPWHDIGYCSRINLVSVCGRMTAVDGYDVDSFRQVLYWPASWFGMYNVCSLITLGTHWLHFDNITHVVQQVVLPLLGGAPSTIFQQANAHVSRQTLINSLIRSDIISWPLHIRTPSYSCGISLDVTWTVDHWRKLWIISNRMHTAVVAWQRSSRATLKTLINSMFHRIELIGKTRWIKPSLWPCRNYTVLTRKLLDVSIDLAPRNISSTFFRHRKTNIKHTFFTYWRTGVFIFHAL